VQNSRRFVPQPLELVMGTFWGNKTKTIKGTEARQYGIEMGQERKIRREIT